MPILNVTESYAENTRVARWKLTLFLRWSGVGLILFSALGFLLQGYAEVAPEYRYGIGLLMTMAMTAGGLLCAYGLHETVGARVFFGLAVLFAAVQSTQVGAMLYAWLHPNERLSLDYGWLRFEGVSQAVIALDLLITAVVVWLVGYSGFAILARSQVKSLLPAFLLGNLALLLPSRDAWAMALAVVGLFAYLRRMEARLRLEYSMRTWEGRAARALIFTPWLILLGRGWLHGADWLYLAASCSLAAFVLIWEMKRYVQNPGIVLVGEALGMILAAFAWIQVFTGLNRYFAYGLPVSGFVLPLGWLGLGLATQVRYGASAYRILSGGGVLIALLLDSGAGWPLLLAGIVWTAAGIHYRERCTMLVGVTALVAGTVNYLMALVHLYTQAPWASSAVLGFAIIVLASWLEKHRLGLWQRVKKHCLENWRSG